MKQFFALVVFLGIAAGVALAQSPAQAPAQAALAPSAVVAGASTLDAKTVTVTGTAKNVKTRQGQRGTMTSYQLCDTQCVNVVQFGTATVTEGSTQTVTGMFRASVSRGQMQMTNVIMAGGPPPGMSGGASAMPKPTLHP